jgi:hypothetical protein
MNIEGVVYVPSETDCQINWIACSGRTGDRLRRPLHG